MNKRLFLVGALMMIMAAAYATHYRAGELTYEVLSYLTYRVTVTTYTTDINQSPDSDSVLVHWGDGTSSSAWRQNGNGTPLGNNIKRNVYTATHTYLGPLSYFLISVQDPNRIDYIENINGRNSVNVPFYIEDTLMVYNPSFVGGNNSPILLNPPIDFANLNDTFYHNPAAYDPDGDSLTFELVVPLQEANLQVPNYQYPDEIDPGIDNNFTIDPQTGEVMWAVPKRIGTYNIAILVREYREGLLMGTVLRDMQIYVKDQFNNPPQLDEIHDTCIVAGSPLSIGVYAYDSDANQRVYLSATGGPLEVPSSPAVFTSTSNVNFATGDFVWQTNCTHIRKQFYQVVFKAEDDYRTSDGAEPLVDLETWTIKVVAPGPENLIATPNGKTVELEWDDPYACNGSQTDNFVGFSVWRREGPNPFTIDTCTPGLAGRGYTQIADLVTDYAYVDSNVTQGKEYCYRVLAEFANTTSLGFLYNRVPSLPSNESCSELRREVPLITHATVDVTDASTGEITVTWIPPAVGTNGLDTVRFPGPYRYELYGATGFTGTGATSLSSFTSNTYQGLLDDTIYLHTGLNTVDNAYSYYIEFYSHGGDTLVGTCDPASSVYLTVGADDEQLNLTWEEQVTWLNIAYEVNKLNSTTLVYEPIDTVDVPEYFDTGLNNGEEYCYYIRSIGYYTAPDLIQDTLLNLSQRACGIPIDTIPPCPPVLEAGNDCSSVIDGEECAAEDAEIFNQLQWENVDSCADDVVIYRIYYSLPGGTDYEFVDTTSQLDFRHALQTTLAGCYGVTAVDEEGNESELSNIVCVDNCPCYILPNVFTPNGDGDNDYFTPRIPYRLVDEVEMKIYNRWGELVYTTHDPLIQWDGNDSKTGKPLDEDVYYYVCKVYEVRVDGVVESDRVLSGYIHLIRGNGNSN